MNLLRFVVGIDGLEPSDAALAWALESASVGGEDLLLVTVVERPAGQTLADCPAELVEEAERLLERAVERVPEALQDRIGTKILVGPAAQTLADFCGDDDMLVIGTHKTGFLHGRVTGSRGLQLAARVRSRLVVVPGVHGTGRRGVVIGLTPGRDWTGAVRAAGVHASRFGEEIRIVQAADPAALESTSPPQAELAAVDPALLVSSAIEHLLAEDFPGVRVVSRRSKRDAVAAFLDASRSAALLIIPVLDDEREVDFVGSVAHDVLLNINAPVVLIPSAPTEGARPAESAADAEASVYAPRYARSSGGVLPAPVSARRAARLPVAAPPSATQPLPVQPVAQPAPAQPVPIETAPSKPSTAKPAATGPVLTQPAPKPAPAAPVAAPPAPVASPSRSRSAGSDDALPPHRPHAY